MSFNALIVGINQYQNLRHLSLPADDATAIAKILRENCDFGITYLPELIEDKNLRIDPNPKNKVTVRILKDALTQLFTPNTAQAPDTALFYFAGHGILDTKGGNEGYLCAYNSNPAEEFYGLSLKWLRDLLQRSPIKTQIIWLDCCHSGALLNFNEANPSESGNARSRCFIAASRDYEVSYEEIEGNHGVLTSALLRGLDCSHQSEVTADALINFVKTELKNETQEPMTFSVGSRIVLTCNPQYQKPDSPTFVETPAYEKGSILINAAFFTKQINPYNSNAELKQAYYGGTKAVQWVGIVQQLDARRQDYQAAKQAIIQSFDNENAVAALIKGDGGSGKSVLLRRLAHDLSIDYRVYWLEDIEAFLEGEWQYEINKQPADNSIQTVIFIEDWYQHIENSSLEKEAIELLNKVSKKNAVRLVIGDRFAKGNRKKAYAAYSD